VPGAAASLKDLKLLKSGSWLNDELVNFIGVGITGAPSVQLSVSFACRLHSTRLIRHVPLRAGRPAAGERERLRRLHGASTPSARSPSSSRASSLMLCLSTLCSACSWSRFRARSTSSTSRRGTCPSASRCRSRFSCASTSSRRVAERRLRHARSLRQKMVLQVDKRDLLAAEHALVRRVAALASPAPRPRRNESLIDAFDTLAACARRWSFRSTSATSSTSSCGSSFSSAPLSLPLLNLPLLRYVVLAVLPPLPLLLML